MSHSLAWMHYVAPSGTRLDEALPLHHLTTAVVSMLEVLEVKLFLSVGVLLAAATQLSACSCVAVAYNTPLLRTSSISLSSSKLTLVPGQLCIRSWYCHQSKHTAACLTEVVYRDKHVKLLSLAISPITVPWFELWHRDSPSGSDRSHSLLVNGWITYSASMSLLPWQSRCQGKRSSQSQAR